MRQYGRETCKSWSRLLVVLCTTAASVGCGGTYEARVSGTVRLDGKQLERGVVTYHPQGHGPTAYGVINRHGKYVVMTGREYGITPGNYDVTVVSNDLPERRPGHSGPPPAGKRLTSEQLSDKETTNLHYTVVAGSNEINLDLNTP